MIPSPGQERFPNGPFNGRPGSGDALRAKDCAVGVGEGEPVPAGEKLKKSAVDNGRQTDAAVAHHSKSDEERLAPQLPLSHMMIGHLAHQQGPFLFSAFKYEKLFAFRNMRREKRGCGSRNRKS